MRADADGDNHSAVLHLPCRVLFVGVTLLSAELSLLQVTVAPEHTGRGGRQQRWAHTASFTAHKLRCRQHPQAPNTSFPDALPVIPRLRAEGGGDKALLPVGIRTQNSPWNPWEIYSQLTHDHIKPTR